MTETTMEHREALRKLIERADNTPGAFITIRRDELNALLTQRDPLADPDKLSIAYGCLVYETGKHNCAGGTPESGYAHEPGCGYEPVLQLDTLEGWPGEPAEEPPVPFTQEEMVAWHELEEERRVALSPAEWAAKHRD